MAFIFSRQFKTHASYASQISNLELRFLAQAVFNNELRWDRVAELENLHSKITDDAIAKEPFTPCAKALRFLKGLHPDQRFRGWVYSDVRPRPLTEYWTADQREQIGTAYRRALDMLEVAIAASSDAANLALFTDWFGNSGNAAAEMAAMNAQYVAIKRGVGDLRVVADHIADRDAVALAYPGETWNVTYIGNDFWAGGTDPAETIRRGKSNQQAQSFIHEWSHKFCNPQTDDTPWASVAGNPGYAGDCYGTVECRKLAQLSPAQAQNNADNVGYFAVAAWWSKYKGSPFGSKNWGAGTKGRHKRPIWSAI